MYLTRSLNQGALPLPALFSPNDRWHIVLQTDDFWLTAIDGRLVRDVIGNWQFERNGPNWLAEE